MTFARPDATSWIGSPGLLARRLAIGPGRDSLPRDPDASEARGPHGIGEDPRGSRIAAPGRDPARRANLLFPQDSCPAMPPRPIGAASGKREILRAVAGHFGELLQGCLGASGPVVLVTLPAPTLRVTARFAPGGPFHLHAAGPPPISRRDAALLHRAVTGQPPRGRLVIAAGMPVGGGAGSSTAALLAAMAAFTAARARPLPPPDVLARLCLRIEGAIDPLMHPDPARLLWASREGRALGRLPPVPELEVVGGFAGPARRTDPGDHDFADISDLVAPWSAAAARRDHAALGALATASAERNARHRGDGDLAPLLAAAGRFGAVGIVAAHTGSARGLLFASGRGRPDLAAAGLAAAGLRGLLRFRLGSPRR